MSINISNLFVQLGKIGKYLYHANARQGSGAGSIPTIPTDINAIVSNSTYQSSTTYQNLVAGLSGVTASAQQGANNISSQLQTLFQTTILTAVTLDTGQGSSQSSSLQAALTELVRQMKGNYYVNACTVASTPSALSLNTSSDPPSVVVTTTRYDGLTLQNIVPEVAYLTCTQPSAIEQEQWSITGVPQTANALDWNWPTGSGASGIVTAIAPDQQGSGLLANGSFTATWTTSVAPPNWNADTGVYGTDYQRSSTGYDTGYALEFLNGSSANPVLSQTFNNASTGTSLSLSPLTSYAVNMWIKTDGTGITAGVLTVDLYNTSGAAVIQNAQGTNQSSTLTLTHTAGNVTTTYQPFSFVFQTPALLPANYKLRLRISTNLTGANNIYISRVGMTPLTSIYPGGPGLAVFSAFTRNVLGDSFTLTQTNNRASAADNLATFQTLFDRMCNMRSLGLMLPTSGGTLIADTEITS